MTFYSGFSELVGIWHSNQLLLKGQWLHIVITYDRTSVSNNPLFCINGIATTIKTQQIPKGTANSDSKNDLIIFNNEKKDRPMNSRLGAFRVYNRILDPTEVFIILIPRSGFMDLISKRKEAMLK